MQSQGAFSTSGGDKSSDKSSIWQLMDAGSECIEHDGLLWFSPSSGPASWHAANAMCQHGVAGKKTWRLPSCDELVSLFRSGRQPEADWSSEFFWTLTTGANKSHLIVSSIDAQPYVHDNDNTAFNIVLVRRLKPLIWTLVD